MKIKRIIALFCALTMTASFASCEKSSEKEEKTDEVTLAVTEESERFEREVTPEGYVVISREEFASYLSKIDLTTENWKEYLDIVDLTVEERTGFGELVNSTTEATFTAKNAIGCYFQDFAIELSFNESGEKLYCESIFYRIQADFFSGVNWADRTVDDFTCEKIKGSVIILINVPEECFSSYADGGRFLCVGDAENYRVMNIGDAKDLSMNISLAYVMYGK